MKSLIHQVCSKFYNNLNQIFTTVNHDPEFIFEDKEVEIVPTWFGRLVLPSTDEVITPYIKRFGYWDLEVQTALQRLIRPGMTFWDVGASFGYFSAMVGLTIPGSIVKAFEPFPPACKLIHANLKLNGVSASIVEGALTDSLVRSVHLSTQKQNFGDQVVTPTSNTNSIEVPAFRARDFLKSGGIPSVIKIDVQGHELRVIKGFGSLIFKIPNIILECGPCFTSNELHKTMDELSTYQRLGFNLIFLEEDRWIPMTIGSIIERLRSGGRETQGNLLLRRR